MLTVQEAAERLGVSPRTLQRWISQGKIKASEKPHPGGKRFMVDETDLKALETPSQSAQVNELVRQVDALEREVQTLQARNASLHQLISDQLSQISALVWWKARTKPDNPAELSKNKRKDPVRNTPFRWIKFRDGKGRVLPEAYPPSYFGEVYLK
jgi:excisionase family DNA binding protein